MRQLITSPNNQRLKAAMWLQSSRARKQQNRIIVFGVREVERAIAAGLVVEELFVCSEILGDKPVDAFEASAASVNPHCLTLDLSRELFRKIAYGDRFDGVAAVAARPETGLEQLSIHAPSLVLVIESIQKPGNVGAVIRSADGAGASAVISADPAADFFHPNSIRSSVSTVFSLPLAAAPSEEVIEWLRAREFQIVLATPDADANFFETDMRGNVAIVLGTEATGISPAWSAETGVRMARLPMLGSADSLNISAAATAILYLAASQRS